MRQLKLTTGAALLAVLTLLTGSAVAQETNVSERTFLTFSNTFELPGLTLQPGTYVFKLADSSSRNVVQVWTRDEKEMLGHWLFVQAERPRVTEDNVVMFRETPAGTPPAVQYWYFPGERIGKEFIYPKDQAQRIAKATGAEVLTAEGESASVSAIDAEGTVTQREREETASAAPAERRTAQAPSPAPSEAPARTSEPVGTSGAEAEGQVARADTLPETASPLALGGLLGLLALAGAAGVRAYRK
jgi:hypothetical protein